MDKLKNKANILEGSITKAILQLAIPIMAGFILDNIYFIADMYFVGKLGAAPLAAVSMGATIFGLIWTFVVGTTTGIVAISSRLHGQGDKEGAAYAGKQAIFLSIILYVVIAVVGNIITTPLLKLLGVTPDMAPLAEAYTRISLISSFVTFISMSIASYMRGCGDTITPVRVLMISTVFNFILDPILIFGLFGFPKLGVIGSAICMPIVRIFAMIYLLWFVFYKSKELRIPVYPLKVDFAEMWRILKIGIFSSIQGFLRSFAEMAVMKLVAVYGTAAIAAYGIGVRFNMAMFIPTMGLGMAAAIMVGQNLGAGKPERAEKSGWISAVLCAVMMTAAAIPTYFYATNIISVFNQDPEVVKFGTLLMKYFAYTLTFIGVSIGLERALSGAGDTVKPMIASLLSLYVFRIPLCIILMKKMGLEGIWIGIIVSHIVTTIIYTIMFKKGTWKLKQV
ncbi:MAG: MATE family efflux transporter [Firmicutes bacterium]|nr:MATE family efflux transporter [Bacillota bacterium]